MMVEDKMTETKTNNESITIGKIVTVIMILEELIATIRMNEWIDMIVTMMSAYNFMTEGMLISMMIKEGTGTMEGIYSLTAINTKLSVPIRTIGGRIETFGIMIRMSTEEMGIKAEGSRIDMSYEEEKIEMVIRVEVDETIRAIISKITSRRDESSVPKTRLKLRGQETIEGSMSRARMFTGYREIRAAPRKPWRT